jgi:hypothetical protein
VKGYAFKKVWIIICDQCNEDITRAQSGDEPATRAEAEEWAREHQKTWHSG